MARLLVDFNTEFDTPTPSAEVLTRRLTGLLAPEEPALTVLLADLAETTRSAGGTRADTPGRRAPVGFALITHRPTPYVDGPIVQLDELYVVSAHRGGGIGTAILDEVLRDARAAGAGEVHIGVDEPDLEARRFYERRGFRNSEPDTDERMLLYLREL